MGRKPGRQWETSMTARGEKYMAAASNPDVHQILERVDAVIDTQFG